MCVAPRNPTPTVEATIRSVQQSKLGRAVRASMTVLAIFVLSALFAPDLSTAQDRDFRASRTYVGFGLGVYTFHGPVDLWKPRSDANFVRKKDPAFLGNITFPITRKRLFLRGQLGYTSSDRQYGSELLISGENEFIVNDLMWFETDLILNLRRPHRRIMPYVFGGLGLLLADPFGRTNAHRDSIPVEHVKRSQFYFPVGVGVDVAMTRRVSLYVESGMRLSRNSIFLDRAEPDPFNSTLFLAGLRFALGTRRPEMDVEKRRPICLICPRPPVAQTPPAELKQLCCSCMITELNRVFFENNSAELTESAKNALRENVDELGQPENLSCDISVTGYYDTSKSVNGLPQVK
ncbi:MAG: hypothetical protein HKN13_14110, partial [Rhodothermales bacterium]|nr:hypothetical protein [Rhodothermales bacterium]